MQKKLGVDTANPLVSQPDNGEQALEIAETLVRSNAVDLIVVDSVAALVPQTEIEGDMGGNHHGLASSTHESGTPEANWYYQQISCYRDIYQPDSYEDRCDVWQPRRLLVVMPSFYASVRLDIRRIGQIKVGEEIVGNRTKVKVVKNKIAPPFRTAEFDIMYNGYLRTGDVLDLAVLHGIVGKTGAWFDYKDGKIGQGREATKVYLRTTLKFWMRLRKLCGRK